MEMSEDSLEIGPDARLGAWWDGSGVDFRVYSANASAIHLCLFDEQLIERRLPMANLNGIWHVRVDGLAPGALYGYRASGPFAPQRGLLFNPAKLLVDPYALAVTGEPRPSSTVFGFPAATDPAYAYDGRDSVDAMPKCVVVDREFDWQGVCRPAIPWSKTVIYEAHVRGLTRLHPEVDPALRGTFLGLAQPSLIEHLKALGVTAIQLMPVFQSAPEAHLLAQNRSNYWGYSPLGFFAPRRSYARSGHGGQVEEFKTMVRELHRAGLEVILDVVYNHTAEGGLNGPIYGMKGLDSLAYYRRRQDLPHRLEDFTGCGNTLDIGRPAVRRLVIDSLRYWVRDMGVDGFRFDLGPTVGRDRGAFDPQGHLFRQIQDDPRLRAVKWIAEPWDLGPDGYQLGRFPEPWREWNDRYRDAVRRFWRGEANPGLRSELAARLVGSEDLMPGGRSLNYVISHDGFTLRDWVSFEQKHNEANGESNRDGTGHNLSRNWGHEGATDDREIVARRRSIERAVLATLLLSRGTPMLAHGDELGRGQGGNNNPYCQDNETSWVSWQEADPEPAAWVGRLTALRQRFHEPIQGDGACVWLRPDGEPMTAEDWRGEPSATLILWRQEADGHGLLWILHGAEEGVTVHLPSSIESWRLCLSSADPELGRVEPRRPPAVDLVVPPWSVIVLHGKKALQ